MPNYHVTLHDDTTDVVEADGYEYASVPEFEDDGTTVLRFLNEDGETLYETPLVQVVSFKVTGLGD